MAERPDFFKYAQNTIDLEDIDDNKEIKMRIVPLLLTSYDEKSYHEVKKVKKELKKLGYENASCLEDLKTDVEFGGRWDTKFIRCLQTTLNGDYFVIPIFYFSKRDRKNQGLGHHSELIDLIMFFSELVFVTGIFYYERSNRLNQARVIPAHNHFKIKNSSDHVEKVKRFVNAYFPYVERKMLFNKSERKNFYNSNTYLTPRGEFNGKF